jgi:hypothetical protein
MRIVSRKSICCGANVKERNKYANVKTPKEWGDEIYLCGGCKKPCEAYFGVQFEVENRDKENTCGKANEAK